MAFKLEEGGGGGLGFIGLATEKYFFAASLIKLITYFSDNFQLKGILIRIIEKDHETDIRPS